MTQAELYNYMNNPLLLVEANLSELKDLVDAYPYAPTFVFLYLYKLALLKDVRYHTELRRYALLLPDRGRLFRLVEAGESMTAFSDKKAVDTASPFDLIEQFLENKRDEGQDLPTELSYTNNAVAEDYFSWVAQTSTEVNDVPIVETPIFSTPVREANPSEATSTADPQESGDGLGESLFTETLARIYIQQEQYDKALRIIRSLSLNYPEKNRYFADQIRFLEILEQRKKRKITSDESKNELK